MVARVVAVDGDPDALAIAPRQAGRRAVDWREGLADALPVETGVADAVVMTLLLHHLDRDGKRAALAEALRVLRPGGRLVVADWGPPGGPLTAAGFRALQVVDGAAGTDDHRRGRLPELIAEAGFGTPAPPRAPARVWGTLELRSSLRR